jgi:hypothetical protein
VRAAVPVLRACLRVALWLLVPALLLCLVGGRWLTPGAAPEQVDRVAAAPWLHLPMFALAAAVCATALETWPTFARDRPGAAWVLRLQTGPLRGCGAAAAGALCALLPCLVAIGAVAAWSIPGMPAPRAHFVLAAGGDAVLDDATGALSFAGPAEPCAELRLRPVAVLPRDVAPVPTTLRIEIDGAPDAGGTVSVSGTNQLVRVPLHGAVARTVRVHRQSGNLPLLFPRGSAQVVGLSERSTVANGTIAAAHYLLPAFLALALAMLGSTALSLPVNLALVLGTLLLTTLGSVLPTGAAVDALLRGRWLPAENLLQPALPALAMGATAIALAVALAMALRMRGSP